MRRARTRERGAVLVEAAFVTPILFLLIFGVIEIGIAMSSVSSTSSGARAGARYASAHFATSTNRQATADLVAEQVEEALRARTQYAKPVRMWVYESGTNGYPIGTSSFSACTTNCYRYTWDDGTKTFVQEGAEPWSVGELDACPGVDGVDTIGVFVEVDHRSPSGIFGHRTLREHSNVRLEPLPLAQC